MMSQQSEIYESYLKKFFKTHKEVKLKEIEKPDLKDSIPLDSVYICTSIYEVFKLKNGRVISGKTSEWSRGIFSKWFEGSYREVADNLPMSHSEYFEF